MKSVREGILRRKIVVFMIHVVLGIQVHAQEYVFEHITTLDGLPENFINCMHQDVDGYFWIGTHDGLCRYDGNEFKVFSIDRERNDWIHSILIRHISGDSDRNLWILTTDLGIYRYDLDRNSFHHLGMPGILSALQPNNLVITRRIGNDLLVGTQSGLIIVELDAHGKEFLNSFEMQGIPGVLYISQNEYDEDSTLWIGTETGLFRFRQEGKGNRVSEHFPKPGSQVINYITRNGEELLVASGDGIFSFSEQKGYRKINSFVASVLLVDDQGKLWASGGVDLAVFDAWVPGGSASDDRSDIPEGWEPNTITSKLVTELVLDHTGNVWIGTQRGVNLYNPNRKPFAHYRRTAKAGSLSSNNIRSIYEDPCNNLWICTNGGGVNFLSSESAANGDFNDFRHYMVNPRGWEHDAYCIEHYIDGSDTVYMVGTAVPEAIAFYRLSGGNPVRTAPTFSTDTFRSGIFAIEDDESHIWIGSIFNGLYRYDKAKDRIDHFHKDDGHSVSSNIIRDILIDRGGNLWVATGKGINFLPAREKGSSDPVFGVFSYIPGDTTSIAHHYVLTLFEDASGTLWVGTMGGGLNKYLGNGRFLTIDDSNGLPNKVIKGILEDREGNLWISTNKGLSRLDAASGEIFNFDLNDGLQDYEFGDLACARTFTGEMIFGGARGLTAFRPEEIKAESTLPQVVFTELQILNRGVEVGQKFNGRVVLERTINKAVQIRLKHSENSFSISFAGLHYSSPAKIRYRYMLEGFNRDWIRTGASDNIAKYTSLPPGRYTFKVMASNNDGLWNPVPRTLQLRVAPPFWYSWPALVVYLMLLIAVALFFNRYTFIRIMEKHKLEMEQFQQDKIRELSQMKLRFYTNISHEFRTPLTLIMGPVKRLLQQYSTLSPAASKHLLHTVYRNSAMLLRLINQLMDFRKLEQNKMQLNASMGNLYLTTREIFESFRELAFQKRIDFTFSSFSKEIPLWYDDGKIEKILYNLLSNAFKYTSEEGSVTFSVHDLNEGFVEIRIEDSGIGISEAARDKIFERFYSAKSISDSEAGSTGIGLSFSKGLVELHKGEIGCKSVPGQGSTFFFRLRKGSAHLTESEMNREISPFYTHKRLNEMVPQEVPEAKPPCIPSSNGSRVKLLIVEDHTELSRYLKDSFAEDFTVFIAENGEAGWNMVQSCEPDIIISDIMMPLMDGLELCRRLKGDEHTSHIPVILLSAKTNEETQIEGYDLGADAYVSKPFDADVLHAQIQSILRRRKVNHLSFRESIEVNPSAVAMTAMDEKYLLRTCKLIEENMVDPHYSVARLSSDYGMSQKLMNKKLKALTGLTAKSFIRSIKMKRAAQLLETGRYTVSEVTYDVGLSDLKYFRTCFKEEFGITPSDYKKINSPEPESEEELKDTPLKGR